MVLRREGVTLATYGLESGPLGYRPLREFLSAKLKDHAAIACSPDEILVTFNERKERRQKEGGRVPTK